MLEGYIEITFFLNAGPHAKKIWNCDSITVDISCLFRKKVKHLNIEHNHL